MPPISACGRVSATRHSPATTIADTTRSFALTSEHRRAATRLQRQCIAALSSLALNSTGQSIRSASREAVERGLIFLAAFHWSKSVRGEASLALRRLESKRNVPHPTAWSISDCLNWLSCVGLDVMCQAAKVFLSNGAIDWLSFETSRALILFISFPLDLLRLLHPLHDGSFQPRLVLST